MKVLFINPSKWGRGITPIWITSHAAVLKKNGFKVDLFDATFYSNWTDNEIGYNTKNNQYKPSNYQDYIKFNKSDIFVELKNKIQEFKPDIIFWSALSSHIHGEGEYVNFQYGYELVNQLKGKSLLVAGGLQITADVKSMSKKYPLLDIFIGGESELILNEIAEKYSKVQKDKNTLNEELKTINGISFFKNGKLETNKKQNIYKTLEEIPNYDYSLFEDQIFFRAYNGEVLRAIDYEISRGCIYSCSYCVETVIQKYYNFDEITPSGALKSAKSYLRNKSAKRIYEELSSYKKDFGIELIRFQDTNFLTINRKVLLELAELIKTKPLNLKFYIETRPEGINEKTIGLLKDLGVDGVGMGLELSGEEFRSSKLNRFVDQSKIINAFKLLRDNQIKSSAYNIIGLPDQDEKSVLETIEFNKMLNPNNITVAFYTPYLGTAEQKKSFSKNYFNEYEKNLDPQIRSLSKHSLLSKSKLEYYKTNFVRLAREK